jgi:hypothetical protein
MREIRHQSAEQDSAEESPSSIDLLGDEIGCLRIAILFGSAARCAPLGTSASAVSIIARNWVSRKAIALVLPQAIRFVKDLGLRVVANIRTLCARVGCRTRV